MIFRPIPEFPDACIGLDATVIQAGKVYKPSDDGRGYLRVSLWRDGKRYARRVHTLMASAYLGPRPPGMYALHADDVKTNLSLGNLYYGTRSDNQRDAVRNGNHAQAAKKVCSNGHDYTPENTVDGRQGPDGNHAHRSCRTCSRNSSRRHRQRKG